MARLIQLPDGQYAEFPDDMSDSDIESALSSQFPAEEPELDSAWDFSGDRTIFGRAKESLLAVPRGAVDYTLGALQGYGATSKVRRQLAPYTRPIDFLTSPVSALSNLVQDTGLESGQDLYGAITGKKTDTKSAAEVEEKANAAIQKVASDSRKWLNEDSIVAGDKKYQDLWTTQLGGALGSFIPQIGVASRSPTTAVMMGGFSGAGTQAEKIQQARMAGIPVSAQAEAGALTAGFSVGLLENFTPFRILKALKGIPKDIPIPDKKKIFGLLQDFFKPSVIKTGVGEGTQEMTSSVLQQLIEMGYNPDAELPSGESLWNDFSLGFVAGSGAEVVTNAIESRRLQAIKDIDSERERKFREAEDANNFLMGNYLRENAELRDLAQRDPDAFNQLSLKERQAASTIEMPSTEEVLKFNEPSMATKEPTPASTGELYAMRIIGRLRNFFPTNTTFGVAEGQGGFVVTDTDGTQYGKPMADQRVASSVAANLNREIANKGIRGSILNTLMTSPEEYSKEDMDALFRYGFRTLSPEANRVSFAALNEAAGTTTEKGYVEDLPLEILATAKKLRDGRYSIQMPDGSTQYIAGLTAAQKLNMERVNAGLPAATTFDINEARQALGGKIGALSEPTVSGIMDTAQYGGTLQDGKPVVLSDAGEVLTGRVVTDAEKARAGKDADGNNILPDFLEFKTLDEAKRYAGRLNQRGAASRFIPLEILMGKENLSDDIKRLMKAKNITSETNSPEVKQLVKAFTGAESFGDMSLDDQKLFYSRVRELPALSKPTKLPSFSERLYTPEQFLKAVKAENEAGRALTDAEIAAATGLNPDAPGVSDIRGELSRQNQRREAEGRREVEEVQPLESALRKILESFKLDSNLLRLRTRLYDENGRDITEGNEGYFEPALNELALAIDSIDPQGIKTEAQRIQALRGVLTHETIHILRKLDLFTQKEWSLLESAVARTKRKPKKGEPQLDETYLQRARRMYPDVSPTIQVEEAVAELARDAIGDRRVIGGKPRNLIDRIVRFFTQLRNFMDGYGFTSFQDVLRAVETGEIGGRERGQVRSLRLTEEMNAKQLGIVPARYKPFIDEFRGAAELGREPAGAVPGEEVAAGRLPTEAAPGPDADFDIRPTGAGMRQSRRYSVKDIEKLTDSRGSLKTFAQQFGDRIKQSDRTLADADRIAKGYIKEFVENPSAFLPVVTGEKLNVDTFLRMPDGTMYDPKKLEHANATDQTIQIYNAIQNGTIGGLLQREAQALNQQRAEDLSNLAAYLNENADYSLAEQAVIMKGASKYGVRAEKEKGLKLVPIEDNNRTSVAVLTATEASAVAEELRKGKSLKDAMLDGMKNAVESMKKSNKSESFTGWKTFEKSDKEEDAAALKDGCAGRAWCTASATSTARNQLSQGDFHVYYKNGEPIVALRTVNGKLAEPPRGSLPSQFMTAEEEKIAEEALRAGRVEGGEDYLHDRDLINDVISGRHKDWSDIELFTKRKRKYPVGYGAKKYDLPELVLEAIEDERLSRNTERQWEKLGYFIGNAFIQEGQNANIKYVGGHLAVDNKAHSGDSALQKAISAIVNFDPILELKNRGIFGGKKAVVVVNHVQGTAVVNARNTTVAIDYCEDYVDAIGESEVFVGKARLVSASNNSFMRAGEVDKAESFEKAVIEITSEKTVKQITSDNQSTILAKNVDTADSLGFSKIKVENVNRAVVGGSSTMYAGKVNQRISVASSYIDDSSGRAYIGVIGEHAFLNLGYGHQSIFINEMNGGITEHDSEGLKKLYVKKFKQDVFLKKSGELFSERVGGHLYANGTWDAIVLDVEKSANARDNSAIVAGTVKEEILVSKDSAINAQYVGGIIFQQGEGKAVVNSHEINKRVIAEDKDKVTIGQGSAIKAELPPEYFDGMSRLESAFPETGRRYSRKDTGQPAVTQQPEVRNPNLVQRSPEVLQEAVQKVEKSVADTGKYSVPLYNPKASPDALYVALNPDSGEKLDTEERRRYSRRNAPEYDPKAKAIMDRVIPQVPDETTGEFYINKMKGFDAKAALDRARANLFFQHARLERQYRENPELAKMLADTSALAMVQMADHAHQFIMSALTIGVPVYRNGMFTTDDFVHNGKKYKGLIEVMSLLRTPDGKNFEQLAHAYATAVRGERLNKEGKLTPVNPGELKVLEAEVNRFINPETGKPIVKEWFDAWQAYNSHVVKYLRDTGIVDDEGAALWLKQADYVPFYREDKNGNLLHPRVFGGMHTAGQFKAVGTSDEALNIDMLTAIQNNLNAAIAMGMRNVAQQRVVRDQINLGLGRMLNPGEEVGDRTTVSFKRKGKKQTAIIDDPLIYQAMLPISEIPMDNILGQAFRKPAELLRSFIVHDPAYMIANAMRDSISSYVITGAEIVPGVSTVKNLAADLDKLKRLGIVGNYNLLFDKDQVRKFYAKEARKMGKFLNEDWTRPWEALWDILGRMNQQIDAATRVAVYEDVLKRTGNEAEAQYQALSVMNYGRRGANPFVRYITAISPFLNTRFQGLDKLYQAKAGRVGAMYKKDASGKVIREADWRKNAMRFYSRAGLITGLSVLYWVMVSDDDEYKNATPESRDNYYIIPIEKGDIETGKPGLSFRIPIPFEIGLLFKVVPERILETMFGDDTPKDLKDSFWRNLKSTLAVNWPQTILPLVEWSQNKDSYSGRPIVPTYMLNLPPEEQKNFYTNRGAVWLGEKLGMSPMKIEALGYGYGGTIGGYFLQMVDSAMRSGGEEKPGLAWHQLPVIKRFFATANQPGLQAQFYDLKDSVDGITKTVNELSEQGKYDELATFYAKNGHMYDMRSDINFLNRQITKLRDERKMVEQMDIPPESKRILIEQINMQIAAELTTVPMLRKQAFGPKPEAEE